jgi:hypothetical protein
MAVGHLYFESVDAMHAAFEPYMDEIMGDIKNYTNVTPYFQISKVMI